MPSGCLPEPFCEMGVIWGKEMMCVNMLYISFGMLLMLLVVMIPVMVMIPKGRLQRWVWDFKGGHLDPIPMLGHFSNIPTK